MSAVNVIGLCWEGADNAAGGAATAPALIRWGAEDAETYSLHQRQEMPPVRDHGDLSLFGLQPDEAIQAIAARIEQISLDEPLLAIGGDHLVSLPVVSAIHKQAPLDWIVHLDAHLDRRRSHGGVELSHASVIHHISSLADAPRVYSFGIRSRAPEEPWDDAIMNSQLLAPLQAFLDGPDSAGRGYLSLDLDVLDPGVMPCVSNPEPGGIAAAELISALAALRGRIVAADLVELVPTIQAPATSARTAGIIYRELLIALAG